MQFLSNGDFNFPFGLGTYLIKHLYIWSFQNGTPNPDGLIRLPGRIFNFLAFALFGHMGASYFYLISSLVVAFIAFYYFSRHVLGVKNKSILVIGALFFALNPIFLGNLAKVGLVLAVAMLPLCFLAIQAAFVHRKFRYFLLYILCLNISFLHPYTFTVNLLISGCYGLYMAWQNRAFVTDNAHKFVLVGIVGVLLNMYFVLPMYSMGTVSKDIISANVTPTQTDYTALVDVSNTGNFFTGFSLSKNVFKDFEFYNAAYQNVYFLGVFLFYVIILVMFLRVEKDLKPSDRRLLGILFGGFLALIALAATTVMHIDVLIKLLISMPGGWAFRSPLKWQLYIPLALFGFMTVLLTHVPKKRQLILIQASLIGTFILMNAYLGYDVYRKILTPRNMDNFAALQDMNLDQKTVLYVNSGECMDYMRANPRVNTELLQVFTSKNTQLKHVLIDSIDTVNLGSYDYVLSCRNTITDKLAQYDFKQAGSYTDGTFHLYANHQAQPHVFTPSYIFGAADTQSVGAKYDFAEKNLGQRFSFGDPQETTMPTTALTDIFEGIQPGNIQGGKIITTVDAKQTEGRQLFARPTDQPLFFSVAENRVRFSTVQQAGMAAIPASAPGKTLGIPVPGNQQIAVSYTDPSFDYKNLIKNPSFENGLWQKKVSDCYDFDKNPDIGMKLSEDSSSQGKQSLQLEAQAHIACTGPGSIAVQPNEHYLLSYDFQSLDGKYAGYYVSFDDPKHTTSIVRMQNQNEAWQPFSRELTVPKGAHSMKLLLYAYPHTYGEATSVVRYDNVSMMKMPPAQDRFYLITPAKIASTPPKKISYDIVNPTKKLVHIQGATKPFYVATSESYNALWKLEFINKKSASSPFATPKVASSNSHIRMNNTMNAWYVDPAAACGSTGSCTKNPDGSYNMEMAIEFTPQRSFYVGAIVSSITFVGCVVFFIRGTRKDRANGEGWKLWKR